MERRTVIAMVTTVIMMPMIRPMMMMMVVVVVNVRPSDRSVGLANTDPFNRPFRFVTGSVSTDLLAHKQHE
jgi:type IV secretory pathway protease TraF